MAQWYKPQPIEFTPSSAVMEGAGALGSWAMKFAAQKQQEEQDKTLQDYRNKSLGIQVDTLEQKRNDVIRKGQESFHENVGKTMFLKNTDPKAYETLSQTYQNDPMGFTHAASGYASKLSTPKQPEGTFKTDVNGNLHYVTADGILRNMGFKTIADKVGEGRTTNEKLNYEAYADSLKREGKPVPSFAAFYNEKLNSKSMGVGMRDYDEVQGRINSVASKHGLQPEQLSSTDFTKLSPQANYDFGQIVGAIEQSQKDKLPDWAKKEMVNLSQIVHASGEISKLLNTNDSGMLDRAYNKVNQYLGLGSDAEMARQSMSESAYALYRNHQLKLMSGTAVSGSEEGRSIEAFGELWRNDKSTASKMYENMGSLKSRLEAIKSSYNPIAFNYRYGNLERGVDASMRVMWGAINGKQPTQQGQVVSSRQDVIRMMQSKGATPQQIDAYLSAKGL